MNVSRRYFLSSLAAGIAPAAGALQIVVTGGHPGDPECGCAGTILRYTDLGHRVTVLYLNRGEGFCGGAPLSRCASIRSAEAASACRILRARPRFAGQIDGQAIVDPGHLETFARLLVEEDPDIVFTHWPIDSHRDHRAISALTLDAWQKSSNRFALYYYEVAEDTSMFSPNEFVDISNVESRRRDACFAHTSQKPDHWYPKQVEITRGRGHAAGVRQAEGFLRHSDSKPALLP